MKKKFVYHFQAMSTLCELILYVEDKFSADKAAKLVLEDTKRLEKKYNYYDDRSYLSDINSRKVCLLDGESKSLLQRAMQYYKDTNGVFDITIATIKNLYVDSQSIVELESKKKDLMPYVGCEHFKIKKNKILFDNDFTKIDLGGFVKEYAVDRAAMLLEKQKISSALINYGGDVYALGCKPDGSKFTIGIKDPKNTQNFVEEISLENEALTTSASYERSYTLESSSYSHIIAKSKKNSEALSVSVVSSNCVESGVFSTSLMIEKSIEIRNKSLRVTVI